MVAWVLMAWICCGGPGATITAEFADKAACEFAGEQAVTLNSSKWSKFACVSKASMTDTPHTERRG